MNYGLWEAFMQVFFIYLFVSLRHHWHWDILNTHWMIWLNKSTICLMEFANLGCLCKKIHFGSRWANISFVFSAAFFNKSFKKVQEWIKIYLWLVVGILRYGFGECSNCVRALGGSPPLANFLKWTRGLISPYIWNNKKNNNNKHSCKQQLSVYITKLSII